MAKAVLRIILFLWEEPCMCHYSIFLLFWKKAYFDKVSVLKVFKVLLFCTGNFETFSALERQCKTKFLVL